MLREAIEGTLCRFTVEFVMRNAETLIDKTVTRVFLVVVLTSNEFQSHLSWRRISNGNVYVLVDHGKNIALFQGCF